MAPGAGLVLGFALAAAATPVSLRTEDGWTIHADAAGAGDRCVVLIHGGRFTKESWRPQVEQLVAAGFRTLAIDMRGFGASKDGPPERNTGYGSPLDALAAARHLRGSGCASVSIVGASMGADAAAGASAASEPGEIDRIVLLAGGGREPGERLKGRKLYIVSKDDANASGPRLPRIQKQYDAAGPPKEIVILEGEAHAQFLFETEQAGRVMREILRFLSAE